MTEKKNNIHFIQHSVIIKSAINAVRSSKEQRVPKIIPFYDSELVKYMVSSSYGYFADYRYGTKLHGVILEINIHLGERYL